MAQAAQNPAMQMAMMQAMQMGMNPAMHMAMMQQMGQWMPGMRGPQGAFGKARKSKKRKQRDGGAGGAAGAAFGASSSSSSSDSSSEGESNMQIPPPGMFGGMPGSPGMMGMLPPPPAPLDTRPRHFDAPPGRGPWDAPPGRGDFGGLPPPPPPGSDVGDRGGMRRPPDADDRGAKPARKSAKVTIEAMVKDFRLSAGCAWMLRALPPDKQKLASRIDPSGQADPSGYVAEQLKGIV